MISNLSFLNISVLRSLSFIFLFTIEGINRNYILSNSFNYSSRIMFVPHLYYVLSMEMVLFQDLFISTFLFKNKYECRAFRKMRRKKNGAHVKTTGLSTPPPSNIIIGFDDFRPRCLPTRVSRKADRSNGFRTARALVTRA